MDAGMDQTRKAGERKGTDRADSARACAVGEHHLKGGNPIRTRITRITRITRRTRGTR